MAEEYVEVWNEHFEEFRDRQKDYPGGPCILTFSGRYFNVLNPNTHDICIEDIAHSLSLQTRFNGHCRIFYSVAEHCCNCYDMAPEGFEFEALMHDAAEAYVGDMVLPLKREIKQFQEADQHMEEVVRKHYGLPVDLSPEVKEVDTRMLLTEGVQLLDCDWQNWYGADKYTPYPYAIMTIRGWTPEVARAEFMQRFSEG